MESDDEIPEDEEEILVYVEFEGFVDGNAFSEEQLQLDMIGIDTDHPIMQINGRFYEGAYEDAIGTYMFFTRNNNPIVDDPVFDTAPTLKYFAKTRKLLKMQRVFIKPRTEMLGDSEHSQCIPNLDTLKEAGVPLAYQEEAFSFWKNMRNTRINALQSYLEKQRIRGEKKLQGIVVDSESDEDNPFAAYEHREDDGNPTELDSGGIDMTKNVFYHDDMSETIVQEMINKSNIGDSRQTDLTKQLAVHLKTSTAKNDNSSITKNTEMCTPKTAILQNKKIKVVHNIRSKMSKRKVISKKKQERVLSTKKESEAQITTSIDPLSTPEQSGSISAMLSDKKIEKQEYEEETVESTSNTKVSKQLRREAKMKEISERLKVIAGKYMTKKAD